MWQCTTHPWNLEINVWRISIRILKSKAVDDLDLVSWRQVRARNDGVWKSIDLSLLASSCKPLAIHHFQLIGQVNYQVCSLGYPCERSKTKGISNWLPARGSIVSRDAESRNETVLKHPGGRLPICVRTGVYITSYWCFDLKVYCSRQQKVSWVPNRVYIDLNPVASLIISDQEILNDNLVVSGICGAVESCSNFC